MNFTSRVIFSPLLPIIEGEFGLGHAAAGSFFLLISGGYFFSILSSGFVSARINHKNTIALSTIASGITLIALSHCATLFWMRIGLFSLGLSAGLYLPSGLASIKRLVAPAYLARGMAVHELAPNLGFVAAPVLADMMLRYSSWQQGLMWLGISMVGAGLFYGIAGRGSSERGKALDILTSQRILSRPEFWLLLLLFSLAICASLGVYAMLPLFLVSEQGMTPERASYFLAMSRIAALLMPLVAGWYGDRLGNRMIMAFVLLIAGLCTVFLGMISSFSWLVLLVILQPVFAVCFFPSGFAVLSALGSEGEGALAVSLCIPAAFLLGGGVLPLLIGLIGDHASIGVGFMVTGTAMMAGAILSFFVSFEKK
ncbi:MAG: MFS transporter [Pseudomonadota bacterium]